MVSNISRSCRGMLGILTNPAFAREAEVTSGNRAARTGIYRSLDARMPYSFTSGGMSHFNPLRQGSWVVVSKFDKLYLGEGKLVSCWFPLIPLTLCWTVVVLYLKGGGARPTHNYSEACEDVGKLSRMVVLIYSILGDTILSPLTVSMSGGSPDSPAFLYLHQENLLTSLDAHCAKPVENRISLQPGLSMLTVNSRLVDIFRQLERHSAKLCAAVDALFKEGRRRKKHMGAEAEEGPTMGADDGDSASKRPKS